MDDRIPKLLEVALVARHIGWPTRKARVFLEKTGMAGRIQGWTESLVLRDVFAAQLPVVYKSFSEDYLAGKLRNGRGGRREKRGA